LLDFIAQYLICSGKLSGPVSSNATIAQFNDGD
jgi:hypothetical protein